MQVADTQAGLSIPEAVEATGLSKSTLRRRADAWMRGDRSPYAIRAGRKSELGARVLDPDDVERVRLQQIGEVAPTVTAEQWRARRKD